MHINGSLPEVCMLAKDTESFAKLAKAARVADDVAEVLKAIHEDTKHLKDVASEIRMMREALIVPATGRKQVPIAAYFVTVGALVAIVAILLTKELNRPIKLGIEGMEIGVDGTPGR